MTASVQIHSAIRNQMDRIRREHGGTTPQDRALALRKALDDDLERRLYSHPQYLRFVRWVMDTPGGLVSPAVRGFLRFYHRCVGEKAKELSSRGEFDAAFWQERFQSLLGRAETEILGALPFHEMTVLGHLQQGDLPVCAADPADTGKSYQVDPDTDLSEVVQREVRGIVQQSAVRLLVATHFRSNVKTIGYLDEREGTQALHRDG